MNLGRMKELAGPLGPPLARAWHAANWAVHWVTTPAEVVIDVGSGDVEAAEAVGVADAADSADLTPRPGSRDPGTPDEGHVGILVTDRVDIRPLVGAGWTVVRLDPRLISDLDHAVTEEIARLRRIVRVVSVRR